SAEAAARQVLVQFGQHVDPKELYEQALLAPVKIRHIRHGFRPRAPETDDWPRYDNFAVHMYGLYWALQQNTKPSWAEMQITNPPTSSVFSTSTNEPSSYESRYMTETVRRDMGVTIGYFVEQVVDVSSSPVQKLHRLPE
ncbi:hypothetical protein LTS18_004735, partial [Coniosporium uncinatum]